MKKKLEEEMNKSLKSIFKSSLFVFVAIIFSKILTYIYRLIIARYFGPEIYGLFSLAMMALLFLVAFSSLGLIEGILRFISFYRGKKEPDKIGYIFRSSITILFFSSILSGLILYLSSEYISIHIFHNSDLIIFLKFFSILVPFYILFYSFLSVIQAFERIKAYSFILDFLENFLKLVFILLLIFIGLKANAVILSYFFGVISVCLISFFYCKYKISEIFRKYDLDKASKKEIRKNLFSYSWPLIFSTILFGIFPSIDLFMLGYFKNAFEVGIYNAAVPISTLLILAPSLFIRLFFPLVTKEFSKKNFWLIKELSKQIEKWILIINLPLFLLMIIFPGVFINILFGSGYLAAENSLRFLATGFFFNSMCVIFYNLISMIGKSRLILTNIILASVFNLGLNIILIPKYGLVGAASATMISQIILSIIFFIQVKHYTSITPLRRKMIFVLLSGIISAIILIYLKQFFAVNIITLLLQGSFFILSYLLLIFLTKSLDKNDLMILRTIKNKILRQ